MSNITYPTKHECRWVAKTLLERNKRLFEICTTRQIQSEVVEAIITTWIGLRGGIQHSKNLGFTLTPAQKELAKKHGTPAEFAMACYRAVPGDISMSEAAAALEKYLKEWIAAK